LLWHPCRRDRALLALKGGTQHPPYAYRNRIIARTRVMVERPVRPVKRQFGRLKARDRGQAKNGDQRLPRLRAATCCWCAKN